MKTGTANYEYVTARVRSRRSALFDEEDYRKLLRMGPSEIARFMEETEYEEEVDALGARHSGVDLVEFALNRNLAKHFNDLLRWSDGSLYEYVARYLRKFDSWNVKTVFRGKYAGADEDSIAADLIRAGELDDAFLDRLVEAEDVEAVVELLDGTIFSSGLSDAYEEYEESGLLVPIENAVDRAYYENLLDGIDTRELERDSPTARYVEVLVAEIDFRNVRNALRLARSGADVDPAEYFIDGGRLFDEDELRQLVNNREELVARIRESHYASEVGEALDDLEDADSLIGFEHALDRALLEYSDRLSHVHPLSVCPVIAFVLAKEREVENIRAIARGREAGLDQEEIEEELVML